MATLRVKEAFAAFGREFAVGDLVATSELTGWPEGAAERRAVEGFFDLSSVEDITPAAQKKTK